MMTNEDRQQIALGSISVEELARLPETIRVLDGQAYAKFDADPFLAAYLGFACKLIMRIEIRLDGGDAQALLAGKAPGVTAGRSIMPGEESAKPKKVKHTFGEDGVCYEDHGAGTCGEHRKRKARAAVAAAGTGEGSGT